MSNEPQPETGAEELITIARIARPQGVRGEVIADLLTDFPDRFVNLVKVRAVRPDGEIRTLILERSRLHKGRILLKFAACDTVEQAEEIRDARVVIGREQLVPLSPDSYYEFDLIGSDVMTTIGQSLGQVVEVENYGAAPLLKVKGAGREYLIPLASDICREVDIAHKRIVVDPPEGLLEL